VQVTCALAYGKAWRCEGWNGVINRTLRRSWDIYVAFLPLALACAILVHLAGGGLPSTNGALARGCPPDRTVCSSGVTPAAVTRTSTLSLADCGLGSSVFIGPFLEALRHDPCLLFRRPLPSPALPCDHLDATIGAALLPGIKHGFMHGICHSPPPKNSSCQAVSQLIRAMPRWKAHAGYVHLSVNY